MIEYDIPEGFNWKEFLTQGNEITTKEQRLAGEWDCCGIGCQLGFPKHEKEISEVIGCYLGGNEPELSRLGHQFHTEIICKRPMQAIKILNDIDNYFKSHEGLKGKLLQVVEDTRKLIKDRENTIYEKEIN